MKMIEDKQIFYYSHSSVPIGITINPFKRTAGYNLW
jgi:hypothetical protein